MFSWQRPEFGDSNVDPADRLGQCYCLSDVTLTEPEIGCSTTLSVEIYVHSLDYVVRPPSCGTERSGTCPGKPYTASPSFQGAFCLPGAFPSTTVLGGALEDLICIAFFRRRLRGCRQHPSRCEHPRGMCKASRGTRHRKSSLDVIL
jgi:hypothetical protein